MAIAHDGNASKRVFAASSGLAATQHGIATMQSAPARRVLEHPDAAIAHVPQQAAAGAVEAPQVGFDYPATKRGSTAHFVVYYDPSLGADGITIADAVLATCEPDYDRISAYFGGLTPSTMNVIIAPGIGGAYHYGCDGKDIYCDAQTSPLDVDHTRMLGVAEVVEVFSAEQGKGWNCGASNGEGLSRVLATELYPAELNGFNSASSWLDAPGRPNFVDQTDPTDRSYISIGCSVLFLNWLRYELKYGWAQIVAAAASTLAQTYTNLTGNTDGWARFSTQLAAGYPIGTSSGLGTDNPYPLDRHSGYLVQGLFGGIGNFELVTPRQSGGLAHYWRNNDDPALPWNGPYPFGGSVGDVDDVALVESNFGNPGNLELVVRAGDQLLFFWRDSGPAFTWNGPYPITGGVQGRPALIQGRFGAKGNFELVTPLVGSGLAHLWRNNDDPALPWSGPIPFGAGTGYYSAVTMIESNFGDPGNLEVVAQTANLLAFFWRDSGPSFAWNGPYVFESGI